MGVLLVLWGGAPAAPAQEDAPADPAATVQEATEEATGRIRQLALDFYEVLPKLAIALVILLLAWLLSRLARPLLRWALPNWQRASAAAALVGIGIWLLGLAAAFGVIVGDVRALVGSVGLFGLALSWALQTPIESFTGWLLNSFKAYYRVGDRITVGEVHGDVYRIDVLTTTVWEAGLPGSRVQGQSGALVTFPNLEVLRSNIVNYTLDFPYVWSETTIGVSADSDLDHALRVVGEVAREVVGEEMREPARRYRRLLDRADLGATAVAEPQLFVSSGDTWTNITVRYLVPARERRLRESELLEALVRELERPEHEGRIEAAVPRLEVELDGGGGGGATPPPTSGTTGPR